MNLHTKIDNLLNYMPHGWCSHRKAHAMASTVMALRPDCVVEIGVYAGRSFAPMVLALHELQHGLAYAIDPYDAVISAAGEIEAHREWWINLDHNFVEKLFLDVMTVLPELAPHWVQVRQKSDDFTPPRNIGVLHIDGSHTDQAMRDTERYASQVIPGGFVFMDDIFWSNETGSGVSGCLPILHALGFTERYRVVGPEPGTRFEDNWAAFQRIA